MTTDKKDRIPNAPDLRFPGFKESWTCTTINEVCLEFQSGKSITADTIHPQGSFPVYGGNGLRGYSETYNHEGDYVLIGRQGALCGNVRFVTGKTYITEHAIAAKATDDNDTRFLQFLFSKMNLGQYSDQSAQPGLAVNKLLKLKIQIPQKEEQLKIARFLSLLQKRLETQSRAIEDLKRLRLAFQDKLIEQLVCSNNLKSFSEVYEVAGEGGTPDTSKREYYEGGTIPFIKIDDLANKYLKANKDSITELGMQKSSAWLVPANSLIFSNGATIGAASINSYPVATKQGILGIVPKNNISVEYLYYLMTSTYFKKQVHRIITHGTMATAYLKDINKISVPIPSFDKQEYVSLVLSSLSGKEAIETQMLSQLQNQKQYLLQRMFI